MTAPEGKKEKKKKKTHPKRPRKEDFARWYHFSLIRQRLKGWGEVWKRDTWERDRRGVVRAKVEKNKPPGTLMETLLPGGGVKRQVKEAGRGWRLLRGQVLPVSRSAVSQKMSNGPEVRTMLIGTLPRECPALGGIGVPVKAGGAAESKGV